MKDLRNSFAAIAKAFSLWWGDWANQVLVCLAAVLLSLTVILALPAYIGVLEQARDLTHGARTGIAGMWSGFRRELRRSLPWGLLNLAASAVFGFTLWFYANSRFVFAPTLVVFISAAALIYFIWQYFSLACYTLQEEKKIKLAWQNALALLLSRPGVMWLSGLLGAALSFVSLRFFIPLALGSPALIALVSLTAVQQALRDGAETNRPES